MVRFCHHLLLPLLDKMGLALNFLGPEFLKVVVLPCFRILVQPAKGCDSHLFDVSFELLRVWIWVPEGEEAPVGGMVPHEGAFLPCADLVFDQGDMFIRESRVPFYMPQ